MLDTTLRTEFIPGTNLKGQVTGANWSFLLPNLNLERVMCIGTPARTTLATLSQLSTDVRVVCVDRQDVEEVDQAKHGADLVNIHPVTLNGRSSLPFPSGSVDLVLIVDWQNLRAINRDDAILLELERLLKPEGCIYIESGRVVDRLLGLRAARKLSQNLGKSKSLKLWLTPLRGEAHTLVPLGDQETTHYFLRHKFYSPTLTTRSQLAKRAARLLGKPRRSRQTSHLIRAKSKLMTAGGGRRMRQRLRLWAKRSVIRCLNALGRIEADLGQRLPFSWFIRRDSVLVGEAAADLAHKPPEYLHTIAQEAGICLDNYRWGLSADGGYSSRKVVFFLFDRSPNSSSRRASQPISPSPQYVVKLVRDPIFNRRLENEYRGLSLLQDKGIGDRETVPQVGFFGYHADLTILGETVVEGVPFRQRTKATPECPYARGVIDWLTELGASTADLSAATPQQVAAGLGTLFAQFTEIYQLSPKHEAFLAEQMVSIAQRTNAFPLVFQHGDPGAWNIMVTPNERVAFLDWEAAEPQGMPLWDLFYFLRSYCVGASRMRGGPDGLVAFAERFLAESAFSSLILEATETYCERIHLPRNLVEPLFYTCWMHRALKEAPRLLPEELDSGDYVNLLRISIERREAPTLKQLFSLT